MAEALQYYQSFFTQKISPTDLPNGQLEPDFGKGSIAAFISGPWEAGLVDAQGAKGKYAVAPLPVKQSSTSFIGGSNIGVFKDAKNRDGGWKFIQWLSKPDVQVKWYKAVGDLPAVQSSWQDATLTSDPVLTTFGQQLKSAKAPPSFPTWEQVAAALDTEVEKVANGKEDPAAALKAVQNQATSIGTGA
jgi:multiple sugar transport system substrate-binding protein